MKFSKFLIISLTTLLLNFEAFAASGDAIEYKITIKKVELCASGSTDTNCLNPVTLFEGTSGVIDIANATAGATAASLGTLAAATLGTTYTYIQTTMDRAATISGFVTNAADKFCKTGTGTAGNTSINAVGAFHTSNTSSSSQTVFIGEAEANDLPDYMNGVTAAGVFGPDGDLSGSTEYTMVAHRLALTAPITITLGKLPTLKMAFDTTGALGFAGSTTGHCTAGNAATGLYGAEPTITISITN